MMVSVFGPQSLGSSWPGRHSVLDPIGPAPTHVASLWWAMYAISVTVYVMVIVALLIATFRRRPAKTNMATNTATNAEANGETVILPRPGEDRGIRRTVTIAVGATIVILLVFLVLDFVTGRAIATPSGATPLQITVNGHQWWWEITYPNDSAPQQQLTTANELHVPVGRPVVVTVFSSDVIHSFWVPNLNGKLDLVPGYQAKTWFRADTPGVYRGQCAEFCGLEHAKMAFFVVAEPQAQYNQWYAAQLAPAAEPTDSIGVRGKQLFLAGTCSSCHTIRGTDAGGTIGPELTHVASHATIAAGTLINTPSNLARWILDAQRIKPGALMPSQRIAPNDLHALVVYLEGLR